MEKFRFIQKAKLQKLPKSPGVYAFSNGKSVLYIGKATNIRERAKNHFQQPTYRDHLFISEVTKIGYRETDSDIDALLLESQLIKKTLPKYNVMWRDDKGYFYVAITKEPLPRVFLTHQVPKLSLAKFDSNLAKLSLGAKYIGPFVDGKAVKQVLRLLRRAFPYYTAKKHPAGLCSWCHLNLCPGPNPDQKAYKKDLAKLVAILQGKRVSVLKKIERDMKNASKEQRYEEAAKLRNQFWALGRVMSHSLTELSFEKLNSVKDLQKGLQNLLHTKKDISRIEAYDISNIQGKEATGSLVVFIGGRPAKEWYRKFKIHITGKPNDFAMMQETISRRLKHPEWPSPDLVVVDGGKPQLSAALAALMLKRDLSSRLKSRLSRKPQIPVVALAKRKNELFFPGKPASVLLKTLPAPVQNMLLHIRDEAHRFAITYHRKLRRVDFFARS